MLFDPISVECGDCFADLDTLQDLQRRYPEVVLVAVAHDESAEDLHTLLDAPSFRIRFLSSATRVRACSRLLPSFGSPTHVVLDREGRISNDRLMVGTNQFEALALAAFGIRPHSEIAAPSQRAQSSLRIATTSPVSRTDANAVIGPSELTTKAAHCLSVFTSRAAD